MDIWRVIYRLMGGVWIPPDLVHRNEPCILHLTDTPAPFLSALPGLLRRLRPECVIHTGDLVDDIKLGLNPAYLNHYRVRIQPLLRALEGAGAQHIYLCMGNHDDPDTVSALAPWASVGRGPWRITFGVTELGIGHYASEALAAGGDYCLYGHNLDQPTDLSAKPIMLNGLEAIHVILPQSGRLYQLPYPAGTNDQRLRRGKVGL